MRKNSQLRNSESWIFSWKKEGYILVYVFAQCSHHCLWSNLGLQEIPLVSQSLSSPRSFPSSAAGRAMAFTRCSISLKLCWNLAWSHLLKPQCAQSFLAFLTLAAAICTAAVKNTMSNDSTADASQWSPKALNLAMWFSTYSLAKSTWVNTWQSNNA